MLDRLLSVSKAATLLGISQSTLRRWGEEGKFVPVLTLGGHRRYRLSDIKALMGLPAEIEKVEKDI